MDPVFPIHCGYQCYDWGKLGSSSTVAQFARAEDEKLVVEETQPYAELWMGTHPKVPAKTDDGRTLLEVLQASPQLIGESIVKKFGATDVPFLFKVLSIEKVLSIQAHPDKALAARLHATDPKNYPDDNHKPEMAIALTDFEGFCGFRPLDEISSLLEAVPEFRQLVSEETAVSFTSAVTSSKDVTRNKAALRSLFEKVMTAPAEKVEALAAQLVSRAENSAIEVGGVNLSPLIVRLNSQFPRDIGLFCGCLMLNYVQLNAGEGMFLQANVPHAYIKGDIIECMAASDNVVRAGFTPKFKDVKNLVEMLTYDYNPVDEQKMVRKEFPRADGGVHHLYDPPIAEFSVLLSVVTDEVAVIDKLHGPSILVVTKGEGELIVVSTGKKYEMKMGQTYFIGAETKVEYKTKTKLICYRAFCEAE